MLPTLRQQFAGFNRDCPAEDTVLDKKAKSASLARVKRALESGLPLTLALTFFAIVPLATVAVPPESQWMVALSLMLGSGGMHVFCSRRVGRLGGVFAGLLYVYSPHLLLSRAYSGADIAALLALALFPLLLWRVDMLRDRPTAGNFILVLPLQMALLSAQASMGIMLGAVAFVWLLSETLIQHFNREASQIAPAASLIALLALLLGSVGAAPAWWPSTSASGAGLDDLASGKEVAGWQALLAVPALSDEGAVTPALGSAQWIAALLGALAAAGLYIRGHRTRHPATFLGVAVFSLLALGLLALMPPSAAPAKQVVLGPVAACLAIVGGVNGLWLERLRTRFKLNMIALIIALPLAAAIPLLHLPLTAAQALDSGVSALDLRGRWSAAPSSALVIAGAALALAALVALKLRRRSLTARPYWTTPPLTRSSAIGILLGGLLALMIFVITAGQLYGQ